MHDYRLRTLSLALAISGVSMLLHAGAVRAAVQSAEPVEQRVQKSMDALRLAPPGHLRAEPWAVPVAELELELQPLRNEAVKERVDAWLDLIKLQIAERNNAQVAIDRAIEAGKVEGASTDDALVAAFTARKELAQERVRQLGERLEVGLDLLQRRGVAADAERAFLAALRSPRASEERRRAAEARQQAEAGLTDAQRLEVARAETIAKAVEAVRAAVPAHERPEPWKISPRELELELQPLKSSKIKERAEIWADLVEQKVRERNRLLMAADDPANQDIAADLAEMAHKTEAVIQALVERTEVLLRMLDKRGEDVSSYRKYIGDVTGIKLNMGDVGVLAKQLWTWVASESGGIRWALKIAAFLGTLFAFSFASKLVGKGLGATMTRVNKSTSPLLRNLMVGIAQKLVMLVGVIVALGMLGINITPLVAALGAAGLVIGLALQGTLSNFASGLLILMNKPFDVGDLITAGGVTGKVDSLSLVSTRLVSAEGQVMYVPNNQVWNGVITNQTANARGATA